MAAHLLPLPKQRFFDANGEPLAGGKLFSYAAGTTTLQATFTDSTGVVANANPVILDANGEASVWVGPNAYKFVLKTSADVPVWTVDGIVQISDGSVTTAKLANNSVTAEKIVAIPDASVSTAKMADGALTADAAGRAKMADGFVTQSKRAALGQQISSSCGVASTTSTSYVDVTNLSVTITTTGRPVFVGLIPDGAGLAEIYAEQSGSSSCAVDTQFLRGATSIGQMRNFIGDQDTSSGFSTGSGPWIVDPASAGTHTYKFQVRCVFPVTDTASIKWWKLIAFEL